MASVSALLETAAALSELNQRKVGCLVGAAIADAAARPLHWVYDLSDLNKAIASSPDTPEFGLCLYRPSMIFQLVRIAATLISHLL